MIRIVLYTVPGKG